MVRVTSMDSDQLNFDDGSALYSEHDQDCCERHYLTFKDLSVRDFEGLDFDLSSAGFFERVEGYGIRLIPLNGHPVSVPGYGYNNGYYSSNLALVLDGPHQKTFNITECQSISD